MSKNIIISCARGDQRKNEDYQRILKTLKSELSNVQVQIHSITMKEIQELQKVSKPRRQLALAMFGVVCLIAGQDRNFPTELVFHKNLEWVQLQSNFCFNFQIVQKLYFKFQELVEKHKLKQFNILNATQVQQEINMQKLDQCPLMNLESKLIKMLSSSLNALREYNNLEVQNYCLKKQPRQNDDETVSSYKEDESETQNELIDNIPEINQGNTIKLEDTIKLEEQILIETQCPTNTTNTGPNKQTPVAPLTPIKQKQIQNFIERNKQNLSASLSRKKSFDHSKAFDKVSIFSREEEFSLIDKKLHVNGTHLQKKVDSFLHSSPQRIRTQESESIHQTLKRHIGTSIGDGPTPKKTYKKCLKLLNASVITTQEHEEKINKQIKRLQKEFSKLQWQEFRLSKKWLNLQQKEKERDQIESYEHASKKEQFLQDRLKQIQLEELKDIIQVRHELLVEDKGQVDSSQQQRSMLNNKEQSSSKNYLNDKLHFLNQLKTDYKEQSSKFKHLVDRFKINSSVQ